LTFTYHGCPRFPPVPRRFPVWIGEHQSSEADLNEAAAAADACACG
jgi:hypothetical protein